MCAVRYQSHYVMLTPWACVERERTQGANYRFLPFETLIPSPRCLIGKFHCRSGRAACTQYGVLFWLSWGRAYSQFGSLTKRARRWSSEIYLTGQQLLINLFHMTALSFCAHFILSRDGTQNQPLVVYGLSLFFRFWPVTLD